MNTDAQQHVIWSFLENYQEILARNILLFLGSFVTLLFLLTLFKAPIIDKTAVSPVVHSQSISSSNTAISADDEDLALDNSIEIAKPIPKVQAPALPQASAASQIIERQAKMDGHARLKPFLLNQGLSAAEYSQLMMMPQAYLIFSHLKANHSFDIALKQNHFEKLTYQIDDKNSLVVEKNGDQLQSSISGPNSVETIKTISGTIHHSVITSFVSEGIPHSLFYSLENLFHDQIDLSSLPSNSSFKIVLDETVTTHHNKKSKSIQLLAAQITTSDQTYSVVKDIEEKNQNHFYKANGASLEKGFLRAPLHYDHISSPFNLHRFQPILHIFRPHYGVDFAAPYGTKVLATSDGVVTYAGYENGFGNVVKIRFNSEYSTVYGHLAHFAAGDHAGQHVKEGQVIGYVGSTGLATGDHLHYEFHINNQPVDPLTAKLPSGHPLPAADRNFFKQFEKRIL